MQSVPHPSTFIPSSLADAIRNRAPEAEQMVQLHPDQLAIIYRQKWFNLFVPAIYGGLELSLPEALRVEEGLAWTDGSTAWTVTLCSGAAWFIGFLDPMLARELFSNNKVCFAGSGQVGGIAKHAAGGYEITGNWSYASGASHATVFTANCRMEKDGVLLNDEKGHPVTGSFVFARDEVVLHKDWRTIGMVATGSFGFEVKQLQVPLNRHFIIHPRHAVLHDPLYQYPFLQLAEATLAVNSAGMAARFLELCEGMWKEEKYGQRRTDAGQSLVSLHAAALDRLQQARHAFYYEVEASWQEVKQQGAAVPALLARVSACSRQLAVVARNVTDELYPFMGLKAADPRTEINRAWRNIHTASQHALMAFEQ